VPENTTSDEVSDASILARQLSGLGYPSFAHLRAEQTNPAALVLQALVQRDLEVRMTEALPLEPLSAVEAKLEHSRLAREDTLCRESMPLAERRWLATNRSLLARHWNLLTGLTVDQLSYAV
jgi:hypothetical protein